MTIVTYSSTYEEPLVMLKGQPISSAHRLCVVHTSCYCCVCVRTVFFSLSLFLRFFFLPIFRQIASGELYLLGQIKGKRERERGKNRCMEGIKNTPSPCNLHLNKNERENREACQIDFIVRIICKQWSTSLSLSLCLFLLLLASKFNHHTIDFAFIFMNYSIHHSRNTNMSSRRKEKRQKKIRLVRNSIEKKNQ